MPDDAKLGLLAGVATVVFGAVVYMPKSDAPPPVVATAPSTPQPTPSPLVKPEVAGMTASFSRDDRR